jgi:hypothetical protein
LLGLRKERLAAIKKRHFTQKKSRKAGKGRVSVYIGLVVIFAERVSPASELTGSVAFKHKSCKKKTTK